MKQYNTIKAKYPDAMLLFRVGDFYETFGQDAVKCARILGIVLTNRNNFIASQEVVKALLLGVSELKLKEAKTSREGLLPRLHVEDVSKKDSKSNP